MGRVRQHSCCPASTRGEPPVAFAALTVVLAVLSVATAPALAATNGRGCAKVPGGPDRAAILQYCPKQADRASRDDVSATPDGSNGAIAGGQPPASGGGGGETGEPGQRTLPLLQYPGTDMVSAIVWVLLGALTLLAARFAYDRYLAERLRGRRVRPPTGTARGR